MSDIAMHLLDIIFNSIRAKARLIKIYIEDSQKEDKIVCRIEDDGCGMDEQTQIEVQNPFFTTRTTRDVGLGIPLFKQGALQTGGQFHLASKLGEGTVIEAVYVKSNIDCPSLGECVSPCRVRSSWPSWRFCPRWPFGSSASSRSSPISTAVPRC